MINPLVPHIKFIEALVFARKTLPEIQEICEKLGLEFPENVVRVIHATLVAEYQKDFAKFSPTVATLNKLGIAEAWVYYAHRGEEAVDTSRFKKAIQILDDPLMFRLITSVALAKITEEDIGLIVTGNFNTEYDELDVKCFLHYFFNVNDWTLKDRKNYIDLKVKRKELIEPYNLALKGDKHHVLWKLGAAPAPDFAMALQDMFNDAYYNFKEHQSVDPQIAQKWSDLAIKLAEKISKHEKDVTGGNPLDEIQFVLKTVQTTKKSIGPDDTKHNLDGKNHKEVHISKIKNIG